MQHTCMDVPEFRTIFITRGCKRWKYVLVVYGTSIHCMVIPSTIRQSSESEGSDLFISHASSAREHYTKADHTKATILLRKAKYKSKQIKSKGENILLWCSGTTQVSGILQLLASAVRKLELWYRATEGRIVWTALGGVSFINSNTTTHNAPQRL